MGSGLDSNIEHLGSCFLLMLHLLMMFLFLRRNILNRLSWHLSKLIKWSLIVYMRLSWRKIFSGMLLTLNVSRSSVVFLHILNQFTVLVCIIEIHFHFHIFFVEFLGWLSSLFLKVIVIVWITCYFKAGSLCRILPEIEQFGLCWWG